MAKKNPRLVHGRWAELSADELGSYASKVRRVCTMCGTENFVTVSPPVWADDFFITHCSARNGVFGECRGNTVTVKESWRLLKLEA